ncbi:lipase 3-like [Culex pipiens pallens]|uniref:lipase 3-like n=1 Tax=Culex pipiens pallens TaxID=42434 RepID=UPI001954DE09|nr:lipase 3-like [Culex pipiens pallens]
MQRRSITPTLFLVAAIFSRPILPLLFRADCVCDPLNAFLDSLPLNRERTDQLLTLDGYQGRSYRVVTADGYVLKLYRIWRDQPPSANSTQEAILLMHGILNSSADWLALGPGKSLAYQLVDRGFDVWIANSRSSLNSHQHEKLCTCSKEFWNYSWHEIGYYDLAATIDKVLEKSQQPKLRLIVFSEGGGAGLVLLSTRPEYNDKLSSLEAMAPGAMVSNTWYRFLAGPLAKIPKVFKSLYALYSTNQVTVQACEREKIACTNVYYQIVAGESAGMNRSVVDRLYQSLPAGASMKEVQHYIQVIWTKRFAPYDYGWERNMELYGSKVPPEYPLDRITVPVNFHYGLADKIVDATGVEWVAAKLINSARVRMRAYDRLQHSDFIFGDAAHQLVYNEVIRWIME